MSWILHRIDDRLIHGQVVIAWGERLRPQRIVVADDASASNAWEREVLGSSAPGIEVSVLGLAAAAAMYESEQARAGGAFLLVRDLPSAHAMVVAGAPIPSLMLGGLHYAPGKEKVNEYVYLDAADRRAARALLDRGVKLEVQDVPASRPLSLESIDAAVRTS
ncbi:MAG: PTS sugar transporter subunit IIB [Candidatus Eisenbacteria bacterium]|nr:PTS sugar transporter subunit IIB [Candidatus Eisenbacteria bacterium]